MTTWRFVLSASAVALAAAAAIFAAQREAKRRHRSKGTRRVYKGQCHCGAVKFEALAPEHLVVWDCNCSICAMLKNHHFIIPEENFTLLQGEDSLSLYTFNTKTAKHLFCKHCGVSPFYRPRSNPDGYAITLACVIPQEQLVSFEKRFFDGSNWEGFWGNSGIQSFSVKEST